MQVRSRIACLSAAVLAVAYGGSAVQARNLIFDATQSGAPTGSDGTPGGIYIWDNLTTPNWVDLDAPAGDVVFSSAIPDSARFGQSTAAPVGTAGASFIIALASDVTVQNLTFAAATDGTSFTIGDLGDGLQTLTIAGDVIKSAPAGTPKVELTNAIQLTAVNHNFVIRDTGGDAQPEMTFTTEIGGAGSVTLDNYLNNTVNDQYGTLGFLADNSYSGGTNVNAGRLVIKSSGSLGTGLVTVNNAGALWVAGPGVTTGTIANGDLSIANAIKITRSDYGSTGAFDKYRDAIRFTNDGSFNTHTLSGGIDVASTDARISVNTNRVIISGPLTTSTGTGVLHLTSDNDFNAFVRLTADNTAFGAAGGAIRISGGLELEVTNDNQLGGTGTKLYLSGGSIHATGALGASGSPFMTNFGAGVTHDITGAAVNTGINVDGGQTFNVVGLSGVAVGKRGLGTLNFDGTTTANTFTGAPFFDAGDVNFAGTTSFGGFRIRNASLNIGNGAVVNTTSTFSNIGSDTPDNGTVNVTGTGQLNLANLQDFYVGDNAGTATAVTTGTLNVSGNAVVTARGDQYFGRNAFTKGTLNLSGDAVYNNGVAGAFRALRIGNGTATATGFANVSGNATINSNGELYVGRAGGTGVLTQSGGTINANQGGGNSFVVGGDGNSTGTFTKTGGATNVTGETWIGNGNGKGTFTQTAGTYVGNSWFVVGRGGALGTLDLSGGTITKQGGDNSYIGESNNTNTSTMTVRGTGAFNATTGEFWVGQGGGKGVLNIGTAAGQASNADVAASFSVNNWLAIARANGASNGTLNLYGGTLTKTGGGYLAVGSGGTAVLNQSGGTLVSNGTFIGEASNGTANLSAGTATFTGAFSIGQNGGVFGTLNVSGTASVAVPDVKFGNNGGTGGGTLNLTGGTLTGASFTPGAGSGAKIFNLDGGTLRAAVASTNFVGASIASNVLAGGAKIDTNGVAVTYNSSLNHGGAAATDGGLTKSGLGTLTLTANNGYTGATAVNGGTLVAGNAGALGSAPAVMVNANATLQVAPTVAGIGVNTLAVDALGKVDLTKSAIVVRNGSFSTYEALVASAFVNGGNYDYAGNGIGSSNATARAAIDGATGVGVVSNADLGYTSYRGVTGLTGLANEILVAYTFAGDTDLDSDVDGDDFSGFLTGVNSPGAAGTWVTGDFDYNQVVNGEDFSAFLTGLSLYQGNPVLNLTAADMSGLYARLVAGDLTFDQVLSQVPEPTSLAAGIGALALVAGRRVRRKVS